SVGRFIFQKGFQFLNRRRQSGEVKGYPAQQFGFVGLRRRCQFVFLELRQHEVINGIAYPLLIVYLRQYGLFRRNERPVIFIFSSLLNPFGNELFLIFGKRKIRLGRRHLLVGIV